jgi:hypothetical protein
MALTFRGQATKFNLERQNKSGFQEKSNPGPRQGVGGDEGSLSENKLEVARRSTGSPAEKCSPITQKAKSSPFKIDNTLVGGARLTSKRFLDVGKAVERGQKKQNVEREGVRGGSDPAPGTQTPPPSGDGEKKGGQAKNAAKETVPRVAEPNVADGLVAQGQTLTKTPITPIITEVPQPQVRLGTI